MSRAHICSKIKPKVLSCVINASGESPNDAIAMDGSTKARFIPLRIAVLLRTAGHQASILSSKVNDIQLYMQANTDICGYLIL